MNTSDNIYVEEMTNNWEDLKVDTRAKLPSIYKKANYEVKIIISMLVEAEYKLAIMQDNEIRRNGKPERATKEENYEKENKEIIDIIRAN